jgi:hypothetical protein
MVSAWQRSKEDKRRKHKKERERQNKLLVHDLLRLLDHHWDEWVKRMQRLDSHFLTTTFHAWTTTSTTKPTQPTANLPLATDVGRLMFWQEEEKEESVNELKARSNKHRSKSLGGLAECSMVGRRNKGPRSRSHSVSEKKMPHPTSRGESMEEVLEEGGSSSRHFLCQSYFFTGVCTGRRAGRKQGRCRYLHCSSDPFKSLHHIMLSTANRPSNISDLAAAEKAAALAVAGNLVQSDPGAMGMLCYLPIVIHLPKVGQELPKSLCEQILLSLSQKELKPSSVVYLVIGDMLVFDRNRGGIMMFDEDDFIVALAGERGKINRRYCTDSTDALHLLSGSVLEHILTFLPDVSVGGACQVCKSWYNEIGQHSPNLWHHLLKRRGWPLPPGFSDIDEQVRTSAFHDRNLQETTLKDRRDVCRKAFLKHYSVIRDANAIQSALLHGFEGGKCVPSREMAFLDLSGRIFFPGEFGDIHVWAPNQVLVSYFDACSLNLY